MFNNTNLMKAMTLTDSDVVSDSVGTEFRVNETSTMLNENLSWFEMFLVNASSTEMPLESVISVLATESTTEREWKLLLENWRYAFHIVLVPMLSIVGIVGNGISITVLTRRNMQSSTYFYLTALAVSDLLYLLFIFSLSLKHIPGMADRSRWLYWEYFRFAYWLTDATCSTSTWLTVVFTVERYIAVCHPMKRKIFCTKTRAKRIIVAVYILCFISTVTTPFEWIVVPNPRTGNKTVFLDYSTLGANATYKKAFYWSTVVVFILIPLIFLTVFNSFLILAVKRSQEQRNHLTQRSKLTGSVTSSTSASKKCRIDKHKKGNEKSLLTESQKQGDQLYTLKMEGKGMEGSSHGPPRLSRSPMTQSVIRESTQENKITRMLIAVVILAIFCQMPTALMLIYTSFKEFKKGSSSFYVSRILGNVFNFLTSLNAASNFILYCVMSDRFRKTCLQTFCRKWSSRRSYNSSCSVSNNGKFQRANFTSNSNSQIMRTESSNRVVSWKKDQGLQNFSQTPTEWRHTPESPTLTAKSRFEVELKPRQFKFEQVNGQKIMSMKESASRSPLILSKEESREQISTLTES